MVDYEKSQKKIDRLFLAVKVLLIILISLQALRLVAACAVAVTQ